MTRKILSFVTITLITFGCTQKAEARLKIPFGERDVLSKVADLPDTEAYLVKKGSTMMSTQSQYMDLATYHKEFNIAWFLPLWIIQEPKLVGYNEVDKTAYELSDQELQEILAENKLDKSELNKLGFYTQYGGKIVAGLLIIFIIWGMMPSKKSPVKPQTV
ncbi:hypothetical protein DBR32_05460 [Taibaiella sp. KBW10]|uniref:hypothetical protein n=1 Tax=Taibaiella sp. KBW10 TaxID=2153357 RepID=UPI000F5A7DF6|nr:hypothetical protein [Taibaiella sp. KBW10]RQO31411.1 hypothetical protein DBR32_05460 [Taibaiella sp. KBW10]